MHLASAMPRPSARHCPSKPIWSHETQVPLQEVLQQKPSTQLPEPHWSLPPHARPLGSCPHELPLHCTPAAQSASAVQAERQPPLVHP